MATRATAQAMAPIQSVYYILQTEFNPFLVLHLAWHCDGTFSEPFHLSLRLVPLSDGVYGKTSSLQEHEPRATASLLWTKFLDQKQHGAECCQSGEGFPNSQMLLLTEASYVEAKSVPRMCGYSSEDTSWPSP